MAEERVDELEERLARLKGAGGNGAATAAPDADDLDWFLFRSFPGCEVEPERFAALLPLYEQAVAAGAAFDLELLWVRVLELGDRIAEDARLSLAQAAAQRILADGFDPGDGIAAVRFALRVLPESDPFLSRLLQDAACERIRFHLTLDFVLDERGLDDYLAVSYLREGDPDVDAMLARFPVPASARAKLAAFLEGDASRRRIEDGWTRWTEPEERGMLVEALGAKLPGFAV